MNKTDRLKEQLTTPRKSRKEKRVKGKDWLSSGSTLLNLCMSDTIKGGFAKGKYYHLFGTSDSGKTYLSLTSFAEAMISEAFRDYRIIFDAPEDGALMDMAGHFGSEVERRIEPPRGTREAPLFSYSTEDFFYNMDDALSHERPCLYVLDSFDALTAKADTKKFQETKKKARNPKAKKEEAGSYGMAKAKSAAGGMREVFNKLKQSKSILIIISQAKESVSFGWGDDYTWSGGSSLKFYCHAQIFTQKIASLKTVIKEKKHEIGTLSGIKIVRNRHTGRKTSCKVPIYWSSGIDDVGSCVKYLIEYGHWKKDKGFIDAKDLGFRLREEDLIQRIEDENLEPDLRLIVGDVWNGIKSACSVKRKRRYQ